MKLEILRALDVYVDAFHDYGENIAREYSLIEDKLSLSSASVSSSDTYGTRMLLRSIEDQAKSASRVARMVSDQCQALRRRL